MTESIKNLRKSDDVEVRCSVCEEIGRFGAVDGVLVLVRAAPSEKDAGKIRQLLRYPGISPQGSDNRSGAVSGSGKIHAIE